MINGEGIRTTFILFNNSNTTASLTMNIKDDDGAPLDINIPGLGEANPYSLLLPVGKTKILPSDGSGPIQTGAARILSNLGIGVSAIFSLFDPDGTTLITEAGIGAAPGTTEFSFAVDARGPFNTGLALQNLSPDPTEVTFQLFDPDGNSREAPVVKTLAGNGHLSVFVSGADGLLPNLGDILGMIKATATSEVAALTIRQRVDTGKPLTSLPVFPADSQQTSFALPQIAKASNIRTTFVMFNLSSTAAADATLSLTRDDGTPFQVGLSNGQSGSQFGFNIPPCGVVFVETDRMGELSVGAARVESSIPIGVSAIFTIFDESGNIVTEAGVGDSKQNLAFSLPVDLTQGFDTGMAVFNANPDPATIQVDFLPGGDGVEPQGIRFQVAPLSLAPLNQVARFVSELIPGLGQVQGQLAVTSDLPVAALTLRQGSASLTTLPVQPGVADDDQIQSDPLPATLFGLDATSSRIVNQQLRNGFRVGGRVDLSDDAIPDLLLSVSALKDDGQVFFASIDPSTNGYSVAVPEGSYSLQVRSLTGRLTAPASVNSSVILFSDNVFITQLFSIEEVNQDRTENLLIAAPEVVEVSGRLELSNLHPELPSSRPVLYFSSANFTARLEVEPDRSF